MMTRVFLALSLILFPLFAPPASAKNISRGCSGKIEIIFPWGARTKLADIGGRGACKAGKPNQCRLNANKVMNQCAKALWDSRWSHQIPENCRTWPSGGRTKAGIRWTQILTMLPHGGNSLKDRIEYNTCCRSGTYGKTYSVLVNYTATGDRGCTGTVSYRFDSHGGFPLSRSYDTNCTALIDAGLCGPGFTPSKPSQGNTSKPGN